MITAKVGQAMATTVTRHNVKRQAKLVAFYKALEVAKTISPEEMIVLFNGLRGKEAQMYLLNTNGRITLNLTVEGNSFTPLLITEMVNEGDYIAWNAKITAELDGPKEQAQPVQRPSRSNKISNPKSVSQKAKLHDVTPQDNDVFRVKSGTSGEEYFVRLLPNEDGGTCNCDWGKCTKYQDGYKSGCSHVQAVYQQMEDQRNRTTSAWSTVEDAKRQHRQITNIGNGVILTLRKK